MTGPAYTYRATVLRWVDGDTVDLHVDVGFYILTEARFRLYGIDTPEHGHPDFARAAALAATLAPPGTQVTARTYKADKYGRWLVDVYVGDDCVNARLVAAGLAKPYFGGTKTP